MNDLAVSLPHAAHLDTSPEQLFNLSPLPQCEQAYAEQCHGIGHVLRSVVEGLLQIGHLCWEGRKRCERRSINMNVQVVGMRA